MWAKCPQCRNKCLFLYKKQVRYYHCTWCGYVMDITRNKLHHDSVFGHDDKL